MRAVAVVAIAVLAICCALILFGALAVVVLLDIEARLQARRRQLALRRDIRLFEKGHRPC